MPQYLVTVRSRYEHAAPQHLYLFDGELTDTQVQQLTDALLHDPVVQEAAFQCLDTLGDEALYPSVSNACVVEVAYLPGVTDNEAESVKVGVERLGLPPLRAVRTLRRYLLDASNPQLDVAVRNTHNPLIQTTITLLPEQPHAALRRQFYTNLLHVPDDVPLHIARVSLLQASDDKLLHISRQGILALDLAEMRAIRDYFQSEGREPTDGELETLAQTWSEHCSHKTFKARVRYHSTAAPDRQAATGDAYSALRMLEQDGEVEIDSLIKTFLMKATSNVVAQKSAKNDDAWVLSAFVDNAGIVAFGPNHEVSIKVETHNHPSALEPFGGANTGVGGVVRDVIGVSAQPIANTDVLCFGPLDLPEQALTPGVLHPQTVSSGVVAGVRDYGNKLGIPTVNGAVLYEPGYTANPLVFCGTVGLAPRGMHPRHVQPGDAVVVLGGRTGRDGIHGATFSSEELTHTTAQDVGSAVQIGDPITEKKVMDVIMQARDAQLYSAITDCGAGGLSSAVGEMGAEIGVSVVLDDVQLKYAGLQPWEIWISEAQERMVLAVPQQHLPALLDLCRSEDVEATVIGHFTGDHRLKVTHRDATVVDLSMAFLHDGRPQRVLEAVWDTAAAQHTRDQAQFVVGGSSLDETLKALLAHPNIASKEPIIRTYDHEVGGRTVVKPLVGAVCDGPGDAAVLRPVRALNEGLALGCGINPRYGQIDPYWMALAVVDEALRNVVAVGGDPERAAILDNFCWGDPRLSDRMAALVRAAAGCYDAAVAYGTPFISGKDSLNNEYRDADGTRHAIPPTLLVTAIAHVPSVEQTATMDFKEPGGVIYLVGQTRAELGGAHYNQAAHSNAANGTVPKVDLATAPRVLRTVHRAISDGLVRACHDLSEGGLAVAVAEMALAGGYGARLDLRAVPGSADLDADELLLFAESPTRFLMEVRPEQADAFEALFAELPVGRIGTVTDVAELVIERAGAQVLRTPVAELKAAWQGTQVV